jgi:glutathione peroxidase
MASGIQQAASAAFLLGIAAGVSAATPLDSKAAVCPALWQKNLPRLQDDSPQNLCQYSGKVALVVNTASYCGFTSQYQGLEKVYARFQQRGLVVMGFPSNDFGQQEPGNSKQIADLCFNTYGVKFPMFAKSAVTGVQVNPLFKELAAQAGQSPRWNFHKYLVDRRGKVVGSFPSDMSPEDPKLIAQIEKVLTAP